MPITSIAIHLQWLDELICLAIPPKTLSMEEAKKALGYSQFGGALLIVNSASVIFKDVHMRGNYANNGGHFAVVPWGKLGESSLSGLNTKT